MLTRVSMAVVLLALVLTGSVADANTDLSSEWITVLSIVPKDGGVAVKIQNTTDQYIFVELSLGLTNGAQTCALSRRIDAGAWSEFDCVSTTAEIGDSINVHIKVRGSNLSAVDEVVATVVLESEAVATVMAPTLRRRGWMFTIGGGGSVTTFSQSVTAGGSSPGGGYFFPTPEVTADSAGIGEFSGAVPGVSANIGAGFGIGDYVMVFALVNIGLAKDISSGAFGVGTRLYLARHAPSLYLTASIARGKFWERSNVRSHSGGVTSFGFGIEFKPHVSIELTRSRASASEPAGLVHFPPQSIKGIDTIATSYRLTISYTVY